MALDPYYSDVSLLLPMEGADGENIVHDWSVSPKTLVSTSATISTTESKWGNGSGYTSGSGSITVTDSLPASTDFTVEFWAYPTISKSDDAILGKLVSGSGTRYWFGIGSSQMAFWLAGNTPSYTQVGSVPINTWSHLAFVRSGNTLYFYLNGEQIHSIAITQNFTTLNYQLLRYGTNEWFVGYLQDLRVTKIARYTADFTPPGRLLSPEFYGMKYLYPGTFPALQTISGNVIIYGNGGAEQVVICDSTTHLVVAIAIPDETTGDWSADVPAGDYDISYFAPYCQPIIHGPYPITA